METINNPNFDANLKELIPELYQDQEATPETVENEPEEVDIQTEPVNESAETPAEKRRCYFWKQWKYYVPVEQISLKGWIEWCNELYVIQHKKRRPKNSKLFVDPRMTRAIVKARVWNKDQIEKWLNDHGYEWTMTVETKYQFPFQDESEVILVNADENLGNRT